ncbi:hypothetical protein GCM10010451_24570 [Streptomyces virens]|uniref:Uncharacterized protein n=1 Tax=Streptomyces virens TaxID=285572 RepID=A0ABP6PF40_9ACTN
MRGGRWDRRSGARDRRSGARDRRGGARDRCRPAARRRPPPPPARPGLHRRRGRSLRSVVPAPRLATSPAGSRARTTEPEEFGEFGAMVTARVRGQNGPKALTARSRRPRRTAPSLEHLSPPTARTRSPGTYPSSPATPVASAVVPGRLADQAAHRRA